MKGDSLKASKEDEMTQPRTCLLALAISGLCAAHSLDRGAFPATIDESSGGTESARAPGLVGLWESARTSVGGIGRTLEFRADGTFVDAATVIVDEYYRVVGDRLVVGTKPSGAETDVAKAPQFHVEGDELVQTGQDGSVVRKDRLGRLEKGKPAIVGVWKYRHYTKLIAFERYTEEGRMLFRLPMSSSIGCYAMNAHEVLLTQSSRPDARLAIEIRGDDLSLSGIDGRTTNYRRVAAGAWYDTEHIDRQKER